jgi:hypothetical protein
MPSCTATSIDSSNFAVAAFDDADGVSEGVQLVAVDLAHEGFLLLGDLAIYTPSTFTPIERAEPAMVRTAASRAGSRQVLHLGLGDLFELCA